MRWILACAMLLATPLAFAGDCGLDATSKITVLSNNVGIFPEFLMALYPEHIKTKKKAVLQDEAARAQAFVKAVLASKDNPDVLLLQEIWSIPARDALMAGLKEKYPHCEHQPASGIPPLLVQPSGLMIFSKYPLADVQFHRFTQGFGMDKAGQKGIMGVRLAKDGKTAAIFTTHLQAGGKRDPSVRPTQLAECNDFIKAFTAGHADTAVFLAGDFNIGSTSTDEYNQIFSLIDTAHDAHQKGCGEFEYSGRYSDDQNKRIDYLLPIGPTKAVSHIIDPAGPTISDHLALLGTVSLD